MRGWSSVRPAAQRAAALLAALLAAGLLFALPVTANSPRSPEPPAHIEVTSRPIESFDPRDSRRRFGQLEFRGGLELRSADPHFGGISALRIGAGGERFIAVSDRGRWLRGRLVYDGRRPSGIADAEMAPILGPEGQPLAAGRAYDAESLAEDGATLYVGVERVNQIFRFNYGRNGLLARGQAIAAPAEVKRVPFNRGLETLVYAAKGHPLAGTLIAISEQALDASGNIIGFLIGGPQPGTFTLRRSDDFDVTDGAILPNGDLVVLERRFSLLRGAAMRMRRIAASSIRPGAVLNGPTLIEADMGYQIDNMEGLAVHREANGETVLTLVSDDNFSPLQRTLLLQFTLLDE